jgi:hypothetical protein
MAGADESLAYYYSAMRKHWASHSRRGLTVFKYHGVTDADIVETWPAQRYAAGG